MSEPRLFDKNGYVNIGWIVSCGCPFIVILGSRGTGKTYTILNHFLDKKEEIIFIRRTKTQMQMLSTRDGNPYKVLNRDKQLQIIPKPSKDYCLFSNSHLETDEHDNTKEVTDEQVCFASSLATFYNLRGFDGSNYNTIFMDEIIPEPLERVRKGEGKAFLNLYETVNRNRELNGKKPVQAILAGNTDTLNSEILQAIGAIEVIERMKAKGQDVYINKDTGLAVFDLKDSPIAKKKMNTALYKIANNQDFIDMAIKNEFADLRDAKDIKSMPLNEFRPIFSLNNQVCVYAHKSKDIWYVCKHISGNPLNYNFNMSEDVIRYKRMFGNTVLVKVVAHNLYFESFDTKMIFKNITEL